MYNYKLLNNHYVVEIDGNKYIIDTGSAYSFSFRKNLNEVVIDGRRQELIHPEDINQPFDLQETFTLVGQEVDGLIGYNAFMHTGLTILKDNEEGGRVEFGALPINGRAVQLDMFMQYHLVPSMFNGRRMNYCIDTGARYGYCNRNLVNGLPAFDKVHDYNPGLGPLDSYNYRLSVDVGGQTYQTTSCFNPDVENRYLNKLNILMVGNITDLFSRSCCFDYQKRKVVLD